MTGQPRDLSGETLRKLARRIHPDARVLEYRALTGGSSAEMTAIKLNLGGSETKTVLLRQCGGANLAADPHTAATEFRLLRALHGRGLPVPEALHVDESGALIAQPFLMIGFLDGAPDYAPSDPVGAAEQIAAFLAELHGIDTTDADFAFVARAQDGPGYLEVDRDALPAALWPAHDCLKAAWPPGNVNGPCLLHGDLWPGNLLWQDGRLTAVVDWEDAFVGGPLADLAIARVDMSWSFGFKTVDAFTTAYAERTGCDLSALPLWDLRTALRQVPHAADYAEGWQELGRTDITESVIAACHRRIVENALSAL